MLRRISFKNFVHFEEKKVIDFGSEEKNALNIFVGANHSGKSTVAELIRRCMTEEINVTQTSVFNQEIAAYAFCDFKLGSDIDIISGIIKDPSEDSVYRIFLFKNKNGTYVHIKLPKKQRITMEFSEDFGSKTDFERLIFDILPPKRKKKEENNKQEGNEEKEKNESAEYMKNEAKLANLLQKLKIASKDEESSIESLADNTDWKSIEERYVATFPLRGIGMVQWSRSKELKNTKNYELACKRAEIISTLLHNKDKKIRKKEKEIFDYITFPHVFEFEKDKNEMIWVSRDNDKKFPLLKTSEGVLEAKVTSLLLALDGIDTLCLEEPDKNMHPQMIQRLKTVLYLESFRKTIIVVTHSPFFVDTITIKKTHVFFQSKTESESYTCSVTNAGKSKDLSRVADIETLRTLLFATKVLLVEGPTDREVLEAIFTYEKAERMKTTIASESEIAEKLEDWDPEKDLTTYQIIPIASCENAKKVLSFCKFINLPCLCLLDLDKYVKVEGDSIKGFDSIPDKEYQQELKEKYVNKELSTFIVEEFDTFSGIIQTTTKTFVWKGCLEDAILSSPDHESENQIAVALGISFNKQMDKKQNNKTLKKKLKQRLTQEERENLCTCIKEVPEIKRFLEFMKK